MALLNAGKRLPRPAPGAGAGVAAVVVEGFGILADAPEPRDSQGSLRLSHDTEERSKS